MWGLQFNFSNEVICMLDIKFVRENPDAVKENIKKKFQDAKLPLVSSLWMPSGGKPSARWTN